MGDIVSLVRVQSSEAEMKNFISKVLDFIKFEPKKQVHSVSIKVNLCYYWDAATGCTTDPKVVAGIIDYVRERYGADNDVRIVEADATAMRTKHAFLMLGYEKLAKRKKVKLFNLSQDCLEKRKVNVNGKEISFEVPQSLLKTDLFINVPKLRTTSVTHVTCALKNIFGCIGTPRKIIYHPFLDEAIVGINKILHPHLTVVDGIVALGRYPIKLNTIMASRDVFSIDWVACKIAGYNPQKIGYLKLARKEKIGNSSGIKILGEDVGKLRNMFPKIGAFRLKWLSKIRLRMLKLYSKIVGDVVPSFLETE